MTPCDKILQAALDHKAGTVPQSAGCSIEHYSPESLMENGKARLMWGLRDLQAASSSAGCWGLKEVCECPWAS